MGSLAGAEGDVPGRDAVVRRMAGEAGRGTGAAQVDHEPLPTFRTSPTLMHVMFQNLIGNALKFQDGSRAPEISIRSEGRDGVWQFSVEDNGIGISPDFYDKIFTIFQRLHSKKDYPGTGIGLSTCKKFVELCGGAIWFESTPGQGTRFFFTLPQGTERAL